MKSTNVKRFFTILMTLVMLVSVLSAAVSAAPSGAGIGAADNVIINETPVEEMPLENDNDLTEPVVTYEIPFTKTVKQGGEATPGEETFKLEIFNPGVSSAANGMEELYTAAVTTNGTGDFDAKLVITGKESKVRELICEGFFVRELQDGKENWTYSDAVWHLHPEYDQTGQKEVLTIHAAYKEVSDNGEFYRIEEKAAEKMTFENTYTFTDPVITYEIPFTKTVKLGGNTAPGEETFKLEIFEIGVGSMEAIKEELYTATVTTNGKGDFDGKLILKGPRSMIHDLVCEGFFVREVKEDKKNWTYSEAIWHINPEYDPEKQEYVLSIHAAYKEVSDNGEFYRIEEKAAEKMTFENTYTFTDPVITYEIPFTKTVKLGGNTAPGEETFKLEIFEIGVGSMEAIKEELYTATVTTNGKGDFDGKLILKGPRSMIHDLVCEGFFVREVKEDKKNWTYSEAIWHINPEYDPGKQEYVLTIHEAYTETTADGTFCRFKETPVEKMVFENTYTLNKSNSPKTGDTASLLLWFTLLVVCGGSAAVCAVSMKRRKDN